MDNELRGTAAYIMIKDRLGSLEINNYFLMCKKPSFREGFFKKGGKYEYI